MTTTITPTRAMQAIAAAALITCAAAATQAQTNAGRRKTYRIAMSSSGTGSMTLTSTGSSESGNGYRITVGEDGQPAVEGMQPAMEEQTKDDLMEGLDRIGANAKERNEVNLDKNMMSLAGRHNGNSDLSSKIDMITVRNYEFAQKNQYQKSDLDGLRHKLEGSGWSHLVRNESDGETNDIVVKSAGDGFISDMVILNAESREVNVVHIRGHFRMEDVNGAMGRVMGISRGVGAGAMGMAMGITGGSYSHSSSNSNSRNAPSPPAPPSPPSPPAHP